MNQNYDQQKRFHNVLQEKTVYCFLWDCEYIFLLTLDSVSRFFFPNMAFIHLTLLSKSSSTSFLMIWSVSVFVHSFIKRSMSSLFISHYLHNFPPFSTSFNKEFFLSLLPQQNLAISLTTPFFVSIIRYLGVIVIDMFCN